MAHKHEIIPDDVKKTLKEKFFSGLKDDVAIEVSPKNGNYIAVCEHKVAGEGEGAYAVLFSASGAVLTPTPTRLDLVPAAGNSDEDDPDVVARAFPGMHAPVDTPLPNLFNVGDGCAPQCAS